MIEFDDITKEYPDGTVAVRNISFSVEQGTTTVLVGPSGCGKTTTMKLVNRLEDVTDGAVYYDGTDVNEYNKQELRRNIGYVIQEIGLFDHMTVGENVATVPKLEGWDEDRIDDRVDELLALMDLPAETYRDQYPRELSGGQRQRIGVARALAADPDVLLMDEPFGALDPITRDSLQNEFLSIQEQINTTILFVTHSIDEALKMGDRIAIYNRGQVVQYDTPQAILENPANEFVEEFIGGDRTFKRLQVTPVRDLMEPSTETTSADVTVSPTTNARIAFSRLLEHDRKKLAVVEDGAVVGTVSESSLRSIAATGDSQTAGATDV